MQWPNSSDISSVKNRSDPFWSKVVHHSILSIRSLWLQWTNESEVCVSSSVYKERCLANQFIAIPTRSKMDSSLMIMHCFHIETDSPQRAGEGEGETESCLCRRVVEDVKCMGPWIKTPGWRLLWRASVGRTSALINKHICRALGCLAKALSHLQIYITPLYSSQGHTSQLQHTLAIPHGLCGTSTLHIHYRKEQQQNCGRLSSK